MKRSSFSLSHKKNLAMNMGDLVPIGLQEVLPGDQFQHSTSALIRVQPILAPVMSPVFCMVHHFFVPARLLWDEWEDFITGGEDGESTPTPPYMISPPSTGYAVGSLADYLGIPPDKAGLKHSALPFRAIALIYNEWFRDQDLDAKLPMVKTSGLDSTTNLTLPKVSWQKDYFTTARPWPQKGPDVFIPLGQSAPVVGIGTATSATFPTANLPVKTSDGNKIFANSGNPPLYVEGTLASASGLPMIRADLSEASAVTITDLRTAAALQRYYEKMAQFGSRYVEYLRSIFGVKSSDARLQRPEYLGGGSTRINSHPVAQTAPTDGSQVPGSLTAFATASTGGQHVGFSKSFVEHGYVIEMSTENLRIPSTTSRIELEQSLHRESLAKLVNRSRSSRRQISLKTSCTTPARETRRSWGRRKKKIA